MSGLTERFVRYAAINSSSDASSSRLPSTEAQMDFLKLLRDELADMGMEAIHLDERGTLYASLPGGGRGETVIGLLAHVDTSPEAPGDNVRPVLHTNWDGRPLELCEDAIIDPKETVRMSEYSGDTIITSDGTTLLGADDKAGVAIIMEICSRLNEDSEIPRPPLRVAFTTDEETGRGMEGFDPQLFGADFAYTVDGGEVGKVDSGTFNAWSAEWTVKGREVHPGSAKGIMVNAVRVLSDIVGALKPEEMPENSSGDEGYCYPMTIDSNTAGGRAKMIVRDFTSEGMRERLDTLRSIEDRMKRRYPGAVIRLELTEQYRNPAEILKRDRRAVEYAIEGTRAAGIEPAESSIRGGTDGSRLSFMGIPTVNLPTGGEFFHSRREWIAERGMRQAFDTVLETLRIWGTRQGGKA